ncbi:NADH dehydrogenase [Indibacter alkaliphilus LW1]|uniref:NADH:ubiquinone reductase (non-electrogenic) n=1 Tax=Indibacter alkaliphilus (strain CCUG 57479 / KCTC 22604 / LW1) TaxID=1189612 RepID=S2CXU1_INDAL|nr:NAD(P)/FAD-dependent oxidoreductase [Indibacter alkaliphilus]EOZ91987.1 NADH dehydrogenase [Indibacter alkaliphilus LW1]
MLTIQELTPIPNIPQPKFKRIVIVGAGFAGLKLARELANTDYQVVLLDKNNYHQFQPLFYQVATAALSPSAVSFPLRRLFHKTENIVFRMAVVRKVDREKKILETNLGQLSYDILILSQGANTNFFGNKNIQRHAAPMKTTSEALYIRNKIISNYERAVNLGNIEERRPIMNVVIVGGGATGVELAGAIAELRNQVFPKDYPQLSFENMRVILIEAGPSLLAGLSENSQQKAQSYLKKLGVEVMLGTMVEDFDGYTVTLKDKEPIKTITLLWAAGVKANSLLGIADVQMAKNGRLLVDQFNKLLNDDSIYVLGDQCLQEEEEFPNGHPQVAQVAIQQAKNLAVNLKRDLKNQEWKPFRYRDLGSMATVGKKMAVVDLPFISFQGIFAWLVWLFVHLMAILGVKNKLIIFINWAWKYLAFDPSLRLLIRPKYINPNKREWLLDQDDPEE